MKTILTGFSAAGLLAVLLMAGGCLVSATIVFVDDFAFTAQNSNLYYYEVNITNDADWKEYGDNIDQVDMVGIDVYITNNEAFAVTFQVYIDDAGDPQITDTADLDDNATIVLDNFILPAGPGVQTHLTYGNSFQYLKNVETLKTLTEEGRFHAYGTASGATAAGFTVDSGKVIITLTGHK